MLPPTCIMVMPCEHRRENRDGTAYVVVTAPWNEPPVEPPLLSMLGRYWPRHLTSPDSRAAPLESLGQWRGLVAYAPVRVPPATPSPRELSAQRDNVARTVAAGALPVVSGVPKVNEPERWHRTGPSPQAFWTCAWRVSAEAGDDDNVNSEQNTANDAAALASNGVRGLPDLDPATGLHDLAITTPSPRSTRKVSQGHARRAAWRCCVSGSGLPGRPAPAHTGRGASSSWHPGVHEVEVVQPAGAVA